MSVREARAPALNAPLFAWLGSLSGLAELGTSGYPRPVRRRLVIVNLTAFLIAIFSAVYAAVFAFYGAGKYWPLIFANLAFVAVALLVPLAHRVNDIAAVILICIAEFIALFFFVRELGHGSGIQINYIVTAAVAFAICGLGRMRLVAAMIAAALALHLAAWFLFPAEQAKIAADPGLLANLYVSSAATTSPSSRWWSVMPSASPTAPAPKPMRCSPTSCPRRSPNASRSGPASGSPTA